MSLALVVDPEMEITAEGVALRPLSRADAGLIAHYVADARIARMTTSIAHPLPPGAVEAFVERVLTRATDEVVWVIDCDTPRGPELMGLISLRPLDRDQSEIGYWVAPALWNNGVASRAVCALIKANPLGNRTLFASVFQDNPASARVLTNAGFAYIGDAESFSVARDAQVPTWTYLYKLA